MNGMSPNSRKTVEPLNDCTISTRSISTLNTKLDENCQILFDDMTDNPNVLDADRSGQRRRYHHHYDGDSDINSHISGSHISGSHISGSDIHKSVNSESSTVYINPQDKLNGKYNEQDKKSSRAVIIGREIFIIFILAVAGVFGYLAYHFLTGAEENLAAEQYMSVTAGALLNVRSLAENKLVHGTQIMAKHVGWTFPNASDWPFVWVPSYWDIMEEVLPTSIWSGVNLAPIVMPEQAAAFEDFAYGKFAETFGANTTMGATSHFGKGIWVQDKVRVNTSDHRYHDTTGIPIYEGSPYNYLAPKLQDGLVFTPYTMMNVHGFEVQGKSLDAVMNCSKVRKENPTNEDFSHPQGCSDSEGVACAPNPKQFRCSALSGIVPAKDIKDEHGIFGFIATPIYPANDPYELVGYIFGVVFWVEVMIDIFPQNTIGVDCVFEDPDYQYTYTIRNDTSELICEGDCHDETYDGYRLTTQIIDPDLVSKGSIIYDVTCYPNEEFFESYRTENPTTAAIGAVCIILLTSVLFFLYDYCVRQEFTAKKDLFEAKRKFVRFVSHEVRTPMNSVCMGLSILQEEAASALGLGPSVGTENESSTSNEVLFGKEQIERWLDLANDISVNAHAAVEVLDDFLNYDKIASGEMSLEYTIIRAWDLIEETLSEFKLPMTKKKLTMHSALPYATDIQKIAHEQKVRSTLAKTSQKDTGDLENGTCKAHECSEKEDIESGCESDMDHYVESVKLVGDSVRITQVIRNLVSNAIKFSRENGDIYVSTKFDVVEEKLRTTKIFELKNKEVARCERIGNIVFAVKDNGVGLSSSQLKDLFKAGVQFDVNDLQAGKGSGLGLYISKGIIEQHGGKLSAVSDGLGYGATFSVTLPIYNVPNVSKSQQESGWSKKEGRHVCPDTSIKTAKTWPTACSVAESNGGWHENAETKDQKDSRRVKRSAGNKLKILLVDDSKSNRKLLDRLLSMRGHRCEHAEDGHIGVEMAIKAEGFAQPYDLVLIDYEMPTLNGPEAVKQIREYGCDVFVIGVTGNTMADDVNYFKACGANLVLPKPFKVKHLEKLINQNLGQKRVSLTTIDLSEDCEESGSMYFNDHSSSFFDASGKASILDLEATGKSGCSL